MQNNLPKSEVKQRITTIQFYPKDEIFFLKTCTISLLYFLLKFHSPFPEQEKQMVEPAKHSFSDKELDEAEESQPPKFCLH